MRFVVPLVLILVCVIHVMPVIGVAGGDRLSQLYGIGPLDANLELLLRHRAVMFGLLAALLAWSAFRPALHRLGLVAGTASAGSFLWLAPAGGALNANLVGVVRADVLALALLAIGIAFHVARPARA